MSSDKMENDPTPQNVVAKSIIPLSTSMLMSHVVFGIEEGSHSKLVRIFDLYYPLIFSRICYDCSQMTNCTYLQAQAEEIPEECPKFL